MKEDIYITSKEEDHSSSHSVFDEIKKRLSMPQYDLNERWVKEYIEQMGEEPGFF